MNREELSIGLNAATEATQRSALRASPGGTTLNDIGFQMVKRIGKDFEIDGSFAVDQWKASIYLPGQQTVTTTNIQFTWFPSGKSAFSAFSRLIGSPLTLAGSRAPNPC